MSRVVGIDCSKTEGGDLTTMIVLEKKDGITYVVDSRVLDRRESINREQFELICLSIQEQYNCPVYKDWKYHY